MAGVRGKSGRVTGGPALRRQRRGLSPTYLNSPEREVVIDRKNPGKGYRHALLKRHVREFLGLLPDWEELSRGLRAIVLAAGSETCDGWHKQGIVALCAWPRGDWIDVPPEYERAHRGIFRKLGVAAAPNGDGFTLQMSEWQIRAFQLTHVLLHELGHHHDRMTTRSQKRASRGEGFAESYANLHGESVWKKYVELFGLNAD